MTFFIIAAVIQAGLFQIYYLISKSLQEEGLSNLGLFYYQRLALIPGGLIAVATFKWEYITFLLSYPLLLGALLFCSAVWVIHTFFRLYVIESTNSLSFFNAFSAFLSLPLLLTAGIVLNHDLPNAMMLASIFLLVIGLVLRPSVHEKNVQKKTLATGLVAAAALTLFGQGIDAINSAAYRYLLEHFSAWLFAISAFIFLSALVIQILFWVRSLSGYAYQQRNPDWRGYMLPILFVIASLFEGYSLTRLSIYALVAIGSFTFIVSAIGDLYSRRLRLTLRTVTFLILVAAGTTLAAMAVG